MKKVEEKYIKRNPDIRPGDTVNVHLRIVEGGKERIQVFEGVVISVKGSGLSKTFTVRKISHGVGVEKVLPVNSTMIKKVDIVERGKVRRSKLYYMRDKVGKRSLDVSTDEGFEAIMEDDSEVKDDADGAVDGVDQAEKAEDGTVGSDKTEAAKGKDKPVEKGKSAKGEKKEGTKEDSPKKELVKKESPKKEEKPKDDKDSEKKSKSGKDEKSKKESEPKKDQK